MSGVPDPRGGLTRRRFLGVGAAVVGAGSVGVACGGGGGDGDGPEPTVETLPRLTGDVAVADLAARLENLAIDTYDELLTTASSGRLGVVPAVVGAIVTTARAQHIEHLAVWNRVMRASGQPEVNTPDAGLKPTIDSILAQVADVGGAARLALLVEEDPGRHLPEVDPHVRRQGVGQGRRPDPGHRPAAPGDPALRPGREPTAGAAADPRQGRQLTVSSRRSR